MQNETNNVSGGNLAPAFNQNAQTVSSVIDFNLQSEEFARSVANYLALTPIYYASKIIHKKKALFGLAWEWGVLYMTGEYIIFVPKNLNKNNFIVMKNDQQFNYKTSVAFGTLTLHGPNLITGKKEKQKMSYQWDTLINEWAATTGEFSIFAFPGVSNNEGGGGLLIGTGAGVTATSAGIISSAGAIAQTAGAALVVLDVKNRIEVFKDTISKNWYLNSQ